MSDWNRCTLESLGEIVGGATPSTNNENYYGGDIAWITPKDLSTYHGRFIGRGERTISAEGLKSCSARLMPPHSVLFTSRAPIGYVAIAENEVCTNQGFKSIVPNTDTDYLFLYYLLVYNRDRIENMGSGTTFKEVSGSVMKQLEVFIPSDKAEQRAIAETLSALDNKIENNSKINHHLEQMAQAIFKSWFVDFEPFGGEKPTTWITDKAEDFFDIAIGKTPPRKEPEWFTTNPQDVVWVSISDMGSCGMFISNSSEYLTAESVERFNIKVVPSGSVLLSFKLTVGRVAITDGEMTTNEAIAHFKQSSDVTLEYLYCYLKAFDYQSLGSTSSIATAVNSKTIKAMLFVMPDEKALADFHAATAPLFEQIRLNLAENARLAVVRDALLPRLMSGELSVADLAAK